MGLNLEYVSGQTPLDEDEKEGLLIPTITTRGELDEFEQLNIEEAVQWVYSRTWSKESIFTESFIRKLHKRMFGDVWAWAGVFRTTDKNLGIDKWQIPMALRDLLNDAVYWVDHNTFSPDETAIRFKHRIVSIHCFTNGNGRHSRLIADIIIDKIYKRPVFSWGSSKLEPSGVSRTKYLQSLRKADEQQYEALLEFSRS
jgi:Fic-DOC domain mobile mystery protein B